MNIKRILVSDDEQNMRNSIKLILKSQKYNVSTADNGKKALEILLEAEGNKVPFDLIVTDIQMPGLTGLELIDELNRLNIKIPVLVITGYGDKKLVIELMRKGCNEYLDKPFTKEELLKDVSKVLEKDEEAKVAEESRTEKSDYEKQALNSEVELYKKSFAELKKQVDSAVISYNDLIQIDDNYNVNIGYRYRPFSPLGGDYIGIKNTKKGCDIILADVSGHDMGASFHTVLVKALFDDDSRTGKDGYSFFRFLNKAILKTGKSGRMVTAVFLRIDLEKKVAEVVSAAHPPLVCLRSAVPIPCPIHVKGSVLGIHEKVDFDSRILPISSGDRFFLYSDGFSSTYHIDGPTGIKKTLSPSDIDELVRKYRNLSLEDQTSKLWEEVMAFCRNKPLDDMMLIVAEIP